MVALPAVTVSGAYAVAVPIGSVLAVLTEFIVTVPVASAMIYLLAVAPDGELVKVKVLPLVVRLPLVKVKVPVTAVLVLRVNPALLLIVTLFAAAMAAPVT